MKVLKSLAYLISTAYLLCAMPEFRAFPVSATEEITEMKYWDPSNGNFYYIHHGDSIEITKAIGGNTFCIPEEIDGVPITQIADGAFSEIRFSALRLPSGVTTIPENAFQNCTRLQTVILSNTLERIAENAFDGCTNLCDVFYKGDHAGWDEIFIENGNTMLENSKIHVNYNKSNRMDCTFSMEEDSWSFTNGDLVSYMWDEETVTEYLGDCHPDTIAWYIEMYEACIEPEIANQNYKGACAGFALISYLVSVGVLQPSDLYEGAETLRDIPLCDESVKAITHYWLVSYKEDLIELGDRDIAYLESGRFHEDMEHGRAVMFSYMARQGGHGVVVYGIENGIWEYHGKTYDTRLLTYDNNYVGFQDEACIYFNGDLEEMYVPYLDSEIGILKFLFESDRVPYGIGNRTSYKSTYALGDLNTDSNVNAADAADILTAAANVGAGQNSSLNNGQKSAADVNGDGGFDATDAAKVLEYAAYAGAGGELSFEEYLLSAPSP